MRHWQWQWQGKQPAFLGVIAESQLRLPYPDRDVAIESLQRGLELAQEPEATFRSSRRSVPTTRHRLETRLAQLQMEEGQVDEANRTLPEAVSIREPLALGNHHIQTVMAELRLGQSLVTNSEQFDIAAAEQPLRNAFMTLTPHPDSVNAFRRRAASSRAEVYQALDRPQDPAEWHDKAQSFGRPSTEGDSELPAL